MPGTMPETTGSMPNTTGSMPGTIPDTTDTIPDTTPSTINIVDIGRRATIMDTTHEDTRTIIRTSFDIVRIEFMMSSIKCDIISDRSAAERKRVLSGRPKWVY